MALDDSYLTAGTVSVANGATTYTFSGAALLTSGVRAGDKFIKAGHTIVFTGDPVDEDEIEGEAWPGTALSGATYRIEYLPDGSRLTAKVQELLTAIGDSGNVDALAALVGAADKLPYFTGAGAMSIADFDDNSRDLLQRWIKATTAGPASLVFLEDTDEGANKVTLRAAAALGADVEFVMDANGADLLLRWTRATAASPASLDFHEDTDDGVHRMRVSVPALTADRLFLLPDADVTMHAFAAQYLDDGNAPSVRDTLAAAGVVRTQAFTSSGTYIPHPKMLYCIVEAWGAGGAGGGVDGATSQFLSGGGGGSGGYSRKVCSAADIGASKSVSIGVGGTGAVGTGGGNGSSTSLGTLCIALGGVGGTQATGAGAAGRAGAGAGTGTGDIAAPGTSGSHGMFNTVVTPYVPGGNGGATSLGGNGRGADPAGSSAIAGNAAAANTGGGGSGAVSYNTNADAAGGSGGSGFVLITEFCSA